MFKFGVGILKRFVKWSTHVYTHARAVVDTDETASKIIKEMKQPKYLGGRVTFVPLNQINPKEQQYPNSVDVVPMLGKIKVSVKRAKCMWCAWSSL